MDNTLLLHEAIIKVLQSSGEGLTAKQLSERIQKEHLFLHPVTGLPPTATDILRRVSGATYKDEVFTKEGDLIFYKAIEDKRLFRLTWNTNQWTKPIPHKWSVNKQDTNAAFENQFGFGFEEWLFNPAFFHDGYQYGLIRGAEDLKNLYTLIKEAYLFTLNQQTKKRFFVGNIKNLELIASHSTERIFAKALLMQALPMMREHLRATKADIRGLKRLDYPCVRFRLEDAHLYPQMQIADGLNSKEYMRFIPFKVNGDLQNYLLHSTPKDKFLFIEGAAKTTSTYEKTTTAATQTVNRLHDKITEKLDQFLLSDVAPFNGKISVDRCRFGGHKADLVVEHPGEKYTIFEVKTSANVRRNIREALGQLVDYACWYPDLKVQRLIIVSPEPLQEREYEYFYLIKTHFALELEYWQFLDKVSQPWFERFL